MNNYWKQWRGKYVDAMEYAEPLDFDVAEEQADNSLFGIDFKSVEDVLGILTPQAQRALRIRFGFEGNETTLEYAGGQLGVSRERIRQIKCHALRKLLHPRVLKALQSGAIDQLIADARKLEKLEAIRLHEGRERRAEYNRQRKQREHQRLAQEKRWRTKQAELQAKYNREQKAFWEAQEAERENLREQARKNREALEVMGGSWKSVFGSLSDSL